MCIEKYDVKDSYTGRYFKSSIDEIDKAVDLVNRTILVEGDASMNELYLNLDLEAVPAGEGIGWSNETITARYTAIIMANGAPAISFSIAPDPKPELDRR